VDGLIEGPNRELGWVIKDDKEEWREAFAALGLLTIEEGLNLPHQSAVAQFEKALG
jgi:hypothetical protein